MGRWASGQTDAQTAAWMNEQEDVQIDSEMIGQMDKWMGARDRQTNRLTDEPDSWRGDSKRWTVRETVGEKGMTDGWADRQVYRGPAGSQADGGRGDGGHGGGTPGVLLQRQGWSRAPASSLQPLFSALPGGQAARRLGEFSFQTGERNKQPPAFNSLTTVPTASQDGANAPPACWPAHPATGALGYPVPTSLRTWRLLPQRSGSAGLHGPQGHSPVPGKAEVAWPLPWSSEGQWSQDGAPSPHLACPCLAAAHPSILRARGSRGCVGLNGPETEGGGTQVAVTQNLGSSPSSAAAWPGGRGGDMGASRSAQGAG